MRLWALALGVVACAALTSVDPVMPDEVLSRPVTLQALPSQQPPQVQEAVGRPGTFKNLPAQSSIAGDETVGRALTLQYLTAQGPPQPFEAVSRAATPQFLPATRPPASDEAVARAFTIATLGVALAVPSDSTDSRATASALHGSAPNPFNRATVIRYALVARARVRLRVYDLTGRVVRTLAMNEQEEGEHVVTWDGAGNTGQRLAPGVYLCRLEAGHFDETRRVVLVGE